jgi:hypothetical protein
MNEIDDAELEKKMRRALFFNGAREKVETLDDEQLRMAAKLADEVENHRREEPSRDITAPRRAPVFSRRREKPKVVTAEYYERPGDLYKPGGWVIDVRVNGILHKSSPPLDRDECMKWITGLSRKGVQIKPIVTEWMKANPSRPAPRPPKQESTRKAVLDELGDFKL